MPILDSSQAQIVLKIPHPLAQAIMDYLVKKPFEEVYEFVLALQKLEKIETLPPNK
jgi:aspartyl/asparaginyl-tRNA synthetase